MDRRVGNTNLSPSLCLNHKDILSGVNLKDEDLGYCPSWWAATVATYCLSSRATSGYGFLAYSDMPYSFSFIFGFRIYSDIAAQQDLAFKMTHIEAKSIKFWLRYDPKQNITSCFHTNMR